MVTGKVPQKYPLNIIFLKRFTVFSSMAQWSIRLSGGQAIRVQSAISFLFFSFFLGGAGGEEGAGGGGGMGGLLLFVRLYCLVFSSFFLYLIFLYLIFLYSHCSTSV